jgi:SAM-dependent methyltransferase
MLSDAENAALYDAMYPWDARRFASDAFYDELVMAADAVLDVGCGTGRMLHAAREAGHRGRLVGLDPDPAMLGRARRRTDVEWVEGAAADARWDAEFDLATMTGHAFQCLVDDDGLRRSLSAIRRALRPGGAFVFETRHPQAQAWLDWNPGNATEVGGPGGRLRVWHRVEAVAGDLVTFTETTSQLDGTVLRTDRATLRFLDEPALGAALAGAGLTVEARYGDWLRGPVTPVSRELITIARRP